MCQSFSKNMGLYNERAGCVSFVTKTPEAEAAIKSQLAIIVRHMYSNPPAHGAQVRPLAQAFTSCISSRSHAQTQ